MATKTFVIRTATTRPIKLGQPFTSWSIRSAHTGQDIRRWAKKNSARQEVDEGTGIEEEPRRPWRARLTA
jgi:hypothetical protein